MRAKLEALLYELVDRAGWSVDVIQILDEYEEHIIARVEEVQNVNKQASHDQCKEDIKYKD